MLYMIELTRLGAVRCSERTTDDAMSAMRYDRQELVLSDPAVMTFKGEGYSVGDVFGVFFEGTFMESDSIGLGGMSFDFTTHDF